MGLEKYKQSPETVEIRVPAADETHPLFQKQGEREQLKTISLALNCFINENGRWRFSDFPETKDMVTIGSNHQKADIALDSMPELGDVHVVMRIVGRQWYIIEIGQQQVIKINGVHKRQATLGVNTSCVLEIGDVSIVLTTLIQGHQRDNIATDIPKGYGIVTPSVTMKFPFEKAVLIGSNHLCDIRMQGAEFAAIVFPTGKKLFLHSFSNDEILVDGNKAEPTAPLFNGSSIVLHGFAMTVELPTEVRKTAGFNVLPTYTESRLCFQEITEDDAGAKFILPAPGRAIFVGRGKENYFTIEDHKVSRKHAQVIIYKHSLLLLDCYSTNGTFVNENKVGKKMTHPGDIVQFGNRKFFVCYAEN